MRFISNLATVLLTGSVTLSAASSPVQEARARCAARPRTRHHGGLGSLRGIGAPLSAAIIAIVRNPQVKAQLTAQGVEPIGTNPAQFAKQIAGDIEKWGKVIRDASVLPE